MNIKSNLTIASNIYIQTTDHFMEDSIYLNNVTGKEFLIDLKKRGYELNKIQKRILDNSCYYSRFYDNEQSYGPIKKGEVIVSKCRCEYSECPIRFKCADFPKAFKRQHNISVYIEQEQKIDSYEYLGISIKDAEETIISEPLANQESIPLENTDTVEGVDIELTDTAEYIRTNSINEIVESNIDSHILVNAGPGTGKTYTVMQRVLYLLKNNIIDPAELLVLCYTRAAKKVIEKRIEEGINEGVLPIYAKNVDVCTFDSLATQYLIVKNESFENLNYNDRIKKFNQVFISDDFEEYRYIIVDELQDLVNDRARMVLNLIGNLNSGWLILGDKCQAIYDYDCENEIDNINSIDFYKQLDSIMPLDVTRYEIIGNKRQCEQLTRMSDDMRNILLNKPVEDHCKQVFAKINCIERADGKIDNPQIRYGDNKKTAILCRSNGEAEKISSILHSKNIKHTLIRGVGQPRSLNRWIADVLWDFCEEFVGKDEFIERYMARVENNMQIAIEKFSALLELCNEDENSTTVRLKNIRLKLRNTDSLPECFLENEESDLYVSTIHHAKGSEFERVYLVYNESDYRSGCSDEEARVYYVAATRAREEFYIIGRKKAGWNFIRTDSGRCIGYSFHYQSTHCTYMVVGMNGDILPQSFADGSHEKAIEKQAYIASKISINDAVVLENIRKEDNKNPFYQLKHKDTVIGTISYDALNDFWKAIQKVDYKNKLPNTLSDLYVTDIVTYIPEDKKVVLNGQFRDSGIFLGVKITGFAKTLFR